MEISSVNAIIAASAGPAFQKPAALQAEDRELIRAVKKVNESGFMGSESELTFVLDRETKRALVRIVDRETKEVLQQIPPEYILRLASETETYG
jgi:flagellar protein FlaG